MKHTILLVDDDSLILNTLKKRFETFEMDVYAAASPEEAKKILETVTPELIILDLLLTKDDGSSGIMDFIKKEQRLQNVPVLILTNMDKPELKQMMLEQGVKEYLIKGTISLDDIYSKAMGYMEPKEPVASI